MVFTKKKFEDTILELVGEEGLALVSLLKSRKNMSEFELADDLKQDIKLVRQTLYKLYDRNLIESTRKKDKIKGWYIYYWTLLPSNVRFFYERTLQERINRLKEKVKQDETEYYFSCPKNCIKLDSNQSLEFEFKCPECGDLISAYNAEETIARLNQQIKLLEQELVDLKEEPPRRKVKREQKKVPKKEKKRYLNKKVKRKKK